MPSLTREDISEFLPKLAKRMAAEDELKRARGGTARPRITNGSTATPHLDMLEALASAGSASAARAIIQQYRSKSVPATVSADEEKILVQLVTGG